MQDSILIYIDCIRGTGAYWHPRERIICTTLVVVPEEKGEDYLTNINPEIGGTDRKTDGENIVQEFDLKMESLLRNQ